MIPVLKPSCSEAEVDAVAAVLRSGWWGMGPVCDEFERRLAERYGRRHCVTTNSATAALHLALLGLGVGPGDEVLVPALTFVSTALAVTYTGATPVFCDVTADTLTIAGGDAVRKWTPRTKAIIPVDYAGYPARMTMLGSVPVVQDAAHSCGGIAYGDAVCLSFHPVKNLGSPDGGAILLDDDDAAERLRALRWCGIDKSTWKRNGRRYAWDYEIAEVGYKCHWNDIAASIALAQLDRLDAMNARRREIATRYWAAFAGRPGVTLPADHPAHTWHLYPLRVSPGRRDALVDHLAERGIATTCHYKPLTLYRMYSQQQTPPVTWAEWNRLVCLPMHAELTDTEQAQVIQGVEEFLDGV